MLLLVLLPVRPFRGLPIIFFFFLMRGEKQYDALMHGRERCNVVKKRLSPRASEDGNFRLCWRC